MLELAAVEIQFAPYHKKEILPVWLGRAAYSLLMDTLLEINPVYATSMHDDSGLKPFTTAMLPMKQKGSGIDVTSDDPLLLRFSTLKPELTAMLLNAIIPLWWDEGITLQDRDFEVVEVFTEKKQSQWTGGADYMGLLDDASDEETSICLHFDSPTTFKSTHKFSIPLPEPGRVFRALLLRWNAFAPFMFPQELLAFMDEYVTIEAHNIRSQKVTFHDKRENPIGFTGEVTYQVRTKDKTLIRYLNALADFALYSGVGAHTTVGLGLTRRGK
jgi:CRISPR-associated endoribonuclease Cas6